MASPHSQRFDITPTSDKGLLSTPGSRVFQTPLRDDVISRRLKEAGFDEESIKRRDKATLIAYIAKLEAEIYDHQYQMGLLLLEKKELISTGEKLKTSAEAIELQYRRDQAAHASALAEAKKREEILKKAVGVERQCLTSIEKALHEMRAESAEIKVAAESKIAEARSMMEDAQKKLDEAERKWRAAESLEIEASRFRNFAERKIQEVEEREDDIRRRIISFNSDCDLKENEMLLERKSLAERQRILHEGENRLTEGQALLNQREEYILTRSQDLMQTEKELEAAKSDLDKQRRALIDQKSDLDLKTASLSAREEGCINKEAWLNKKEQDILILQEKLASKESVDIRKAVASHEVAWKSRESEFEAELEEKRKMVEKEIETKQRVWELRELDLRQLEDQIKDREHDLESQIRSLTERERDVLERSNDIDRREKCFASAEQDFERKSKQFQKEQEEFYNSKLDIQKSQDLLKDEKKQIDGTKDELQAMKSEINELSVLEMKLKEELDSVRAEKLEILAEAEKIKDEKAKFEAEWESIDEKREELKREAERVAEERLAVAKLLKEERDNLRTEKDELRNQYRNDAESLRVEREEFMNRIAREHTELFSKFQEERDNLLLEIEMQKKEVEKCIQKKQEELENSLREKESSFEQKKNNELQRIKILEERVQKELEQAATEMRRLEKERIEINLDRERRDKEWLELSNSIEELKLQSEKLKEQRQLLHADREEIHDHIEYLKKLEDSQMASEQKAIAAIQQSALESSMKRISQKTLRSTPLDFNNNMHRGTESLAMRETTNSSPSIAPGSWLKRAADLIFTKSPLIYKDKSPTPENVDGTVSRVRLLEGYDIHSNGNQERTGKANGSFSKRQLEPTLGEEKMIFEVPTLGEDVTDTHTLEADVRVDASENVGEIIYDEHLQLVRKRRDRDMQSDSVDALPEQRQKKKKRGRLDEAAVNIADLVSLGQADTVDYLHFSQQSSCYDARVDEETKISGSAQLAKDDIHTEWVEQEVLHVQMAVGLVTDQAGAVSRSDEPKLGHDGNLD